MHQLQHTLFTLRKQMLFCTLMHHVLFGEIACSQGVYTSSSAFFFHMLTEQQAAVYDRQLRLWGMETQRRMLESRIFISGLTTLGAEVIKNLVLSGLNVTIHSCNSVQTQDVECHFLFDEQDIGRNVSICIIPMIRSEQRHARPRCRR